MDFSTGQFFLRKREVHIFWGGAVECNVGNLHLAVLTFAQKPCCVKLTATMLKQTRIKEVSVDPVALKSE